MHILRSRLIGSFYAIAGGLILFFLVMLMGTAGSFPISAQGYEATPTPSPTSTAAPDSPEPESLDLMESAASGMGSGYGDLPVSTDPDFQVAPAVAYNSYEDEYMVIWVDDRDSTISIYGQVVSADGTLSGDEFTVTQGIGASYMTDVLPRIAYNSEDNEYLVVWHQNDGLSWESIYSQRLSSTGERIGDVQAITIHTALRAVKDVTYNSQMNEYFVVWVDNQTWPYKMHGRVVDNEGVPGSEVVLPGDARTTVAVAYNDEDNEYLAVYTENTLSISYEVRAQRVSGTDLSVLGNVISVTVDIPGWQWIPDVAYNSDESEYLVVWEDERGNGDVYAQRVTHNGVLDGDNFPITLATGGQYAPRVAYNAVDEEYFVVWEDHRVPDTSRVVGRLVSGDDMSCEFLVSAAPSRQEHPDLAASGTVSEWLVVWDDDRNDNRDIYSSFDLITFSSDGLTWSPNGCPITGISTTGWEGGPINTQSGNYHYSQQDISIPALGYPLRFERSYNAQAAGLYTTTLGYGWTHNYDMDITFPGDPGGEPGTLIVKGCRGSRFRFADNGDGTYTPLPGVWATLTRTLSAPYIYTLTGVDQSVYTFDDAGRLIEIHNPQGQVLTLSYSAGRLARVEDSTGQRYLTFSYDGQGRLTEVRDPISRTVRFGYDPAGDLTVVTDTMGVAWTYSYTGTHLLYDVLDPDGDLIERTDYAEYDGVWRAVRQWQGDLSADPLEIAYSPTGEVTITDPMGYAKTHGYDARGTLVQQSNCCGGGGASSRTYDDHLNWTSTTDANGNPTYYDFSPMGRPEVITDALGGSTQMAYDDRDHLTSYTDALGHTTVYTYDEHNNLVATADALGHTTVYTYNASGLLVAQEDPLGNVTRYGYDAFGQRAAVTDTLGHVTTYEYDAVGRLITITQHANTSQPFVTVNTYDNGDNLIRVTRNVLPGYPQNYTPPGPPYEVGDGGVYNLVTEYGYDALGRRVLVTDTLGYATYSEYDDAGRLVRTTRNYSPTIFPDHGPGNDWNLTTWYGYDDLGRQILVTDTLGSVTYTEYDALGRVKRTWRNYLPGQPQNHYIPPSQGGTEGGYYNLITEYGYDAVGNQTHVTDTLGSVTYTEYDELNRVKRTWRNYISGQPQNYQNVYNLVTEYGYDAVGRQVWVTDTLGHATYTEYDALGRPETVTVNFVDGVFDPDYPDEDLVSVTVYDDAGRVMARIDPAGRETRYEYDDLGRQVAVIQNYEDGVYEPGEPDRDVRSETVYNDLGQVTARVVVADARITTTYTYDDVGRQVATTDALSGTTTTVYDVLGRRVETIDAEGHSTYYAYDAAGRLVTTTDELSGTVTTEYDALGRRVAVTDALDHTTVYTYNSAGQLVAQEAPGDQGSHDNVTLYEYDALGRRTVITDADGVAVYSFYDAAGRLGKTQDARGNETTYAYDALGRRTVMTNALGVATRYEYNDAGRLVAVIENYQPGQPTNQQTNVQTKYAYDVSGNLVAVTDGLNHTTSYTYDLAGRRVAEEDPLGNVTRTVYDGHGRRVSKVYPDAGGPITVTTEHNALGWPTQVQYPAVGDVPGFTVEISYDALGHRDAVTDAVGTMTYDYDPLYRPLGIDAPTGDAQYVYNALGQRVNLVYPTGEVVTYTHDAAGRLRTVTDWEGGVTVYTYTTAGRLSEIRLPNGVETRYAYDDAGRLVEIEHGKDGEVLGRYEYELDGLGNRVVVTETLVTPASGMAMYGDGMGAMASTGVPMVDPTLLLMVPLLAAVALARKRKWKRLAWPVAGALLIVAAMGMGTSFTASAASPAPGYPAVDGAGKAASDSSTSAVTAPGSVDTESASYLADTTGDVVVTVFDTDGGPESGLKVYAFDGTTYTGYNKTTDTSGLVTFTLPLGDYRFRADKNSTQFWSGVSNHCTLPGCTAATITTTIPVVVTVTDTDDSPEVGLKVYAFDGTTYTGYNKTTSASGVVTFTLPQGDYRFRADKNGTQFWSGESNHCTLPGCTTAAVTTTIPVVVSVADTDGNPDVGLKVYAFDGTTYTGYNKTTDASGLVTFTLPVGDYRFRADKSGSRSPTHFWSGETNHCTIPGCTAANITTTVPVVVTVMNTDGSPESGLRVYAFDDTTYTGYNRTTNTSGQATFTLPQGDYRFRADKNGTQFWSDATNHCTLPGCTTAAVTTTIPVVVTVEDSGGSPEAGLKVYAFDGTTYTGYNKTTDASGQAVFTLPLGDYRFRADKNNTQYWSGATNHCTVPGCTATTVVIASPDVTVTVQDTDGVPEQGLKVYVFDGTTYTGYNGTTNVSGTVTFTLPEGNYRFRADKNGTQFWSNGTNHCGVPGCASAIVTTTVPIVVTVADTGGSPEVGLKVYAFDGTTYTGYNKTTDASGQVVFTLPLGDYRFRADKSGSRSPTHFWSGETNHCTIPGCTAANITTTVPVVVTVMNTDGSPESGLRVYAFDDTTYTGYNRTTNTSGQATFTLPQGDYRFRADKNGTQFWSDATNHCTLPGCTTAAVTTTVPVVVAVSDTSGNPEAGLKVYAFDETTYTGYNKTTDASGLVTFTLPLGDYRFRADKNGTQFWSGETNHCTLPGCTTAAVTTTIPVVVTVEDTDGAPESGLKVYAFDETTYTGYNKTTDASGLVTFTLPLGDYRFRADKNSTQFWSGESNHCALPGCTTAAVTTTIPVVVTVANTVGSPEAGLKVYAFDGTTYTGYNKTTDASGEAVFTLPQGSYRFRADKNDEQYWSGETNHCMVPGCTTASVIAGEPTGPSVITRTISYTYDPLGRLTDADYSTGESYDYTYDAAGNRLTYSGPDGSHTYQYDDANRLTSVDGVTYTWDDRGNLTNDGTFTYTYNAAGRLVQAESVTSTLVYTYTAGGLLVGRSDSSVPSVDTYAWDWASGLPEMLSEGGNLYLVGHETLGQWDGSEWAYYLPDALGSVRQVTDETGAVIDAREWTPYGVELALSGGEGAGAAQAGLGYTGEWQDASLGMTYLRARWYDAYTGRFTRRDLWEGNITEPQTLLRGYVYVAANPVNFADPSGWICLDPWAPSGIHYDLNRGCDYPTGSTGGLWWRRDPLGEDTPIIDMEWVDEQSQEMWNQYPNSCGAAALYMFLTGEKVSVDFNTLVQQLQSERPAGYDGYCCHNRISNADGTAPLPTPTPDPLGWCNQACVSAETLANVARKYYGLDIISRDNWTHREIYWKVKNGHPVLTLIRSELGTSNLYFGHFVVVRGFIDGGWTVVFNDSYPGEAYWDARGGSSSQRREVGEERTAEWDRFDASWSSAVDKGYDPLSSDGHVRWAMVVRPVYYPK